MQHTQIFREGDGLNRIKLIMDNHGKTKGSLDVAPAQRSHCERHRRSVQYSCQIFPIDLTIRELRTIRRRRKYSLDSLDMVKL